jgi:tellurite resistance protein
MRGQIPKENLPSYLANVLSIAKIEGEVSQAESYVLRKIIHRVGGTQQDLIAAGKLLASGNYKLRLVDSAQERMDNLQDMVMVALSDGDASPQETAPIERIAAQMHYTQADINLAVRRAELELKKFKESKSPRKPASKKHKSPAPPPIPVKPPPVPVPHQEVAQDEPKPPPLQKPHQPPKKGDASQPVYLLEVRKL